MGGVAVVAVAVVAGEGAGGEAVGADPADLVGGIGGLAVLA